MSYIKANREYYLLNGNCPKCTGRNKVIPGLKYCAECQAKILKVQSDTRARYRAEGRCVTCGAPAEDGKSLCRKHLDMRNVTTKKRYRELLEQGMCVKCGHRYAEPFETMCKWCKAKNTRWKDADFRATYNERRKAIRDEWREAGLCTSCGKAPAAEGRTRCERCLAIQRDSMRKRRILDRMDAEAEMARRRSVV